MSGSAVPQGRRDTVLGAKPRLVGAELRVTGIVQGVGFRPHVYRIARELGLTGSVWNDPAGASVQLYGPPDAVDRFVDTLTKRPPPLARIDGIERKALDGPAPDAFRIVESRSDRERVCLVSPDVATCDDCLRELFDPADFRYRYPYINCTNCGPRFTIIRDLPYDRPKTTMAAYPLCERCDAQYHDPADRRFHAQPVACERCGPNVRLGGLRGIEAVRRAAALLREGKTLAVKGIGGYHLACDAFSDEAIRRLRRRKCREEKPLALMAASLETAERLAEMTDAERDLLTSPARPIVLITARPDNGIPDSVAPGNPRLGVMLPYTPLHALLFAEGAPAALVMTSGNRSEEPIAYTEETAFERLRDIADEFLIGEREIHTRCDDSVVQVAAGEPQFLRRSRGYVPVPIEIPFDAHGILAVGAELKNTFALGRGNSVFLSHHVGDLKNLEEYEAFRTGIEQFQALVEVRATETVRDTHPLYLSTAYADRSGLPVTRAQHHHAHVASVMAEHRLENQPVIGVSFDGTGYGDDGTSWGAEALVCDYGGYRRAARFRNLPLAGGDAAIKRNWRSAAAYLLRFRGPDETKAALREAAEEREADAVLRMLSREVNCAPASSAGRLFDAVASLLGVRHRDAFEGQGAMELEALAWRGEGEARYPFPIADEDGTLVIDPTPAVEAIHRDERSPADRAASFHISLARCIEETCVRVRERTGITIVCISGGTFQNRKLVEALLPALRERGFRPLVNRLAPPNDGGIALGQIAIAAWRRTQCA